MAISILDLGVLCSGGIGVATAKMLAQHGCSIAVHHSSQASKAKADALVAELTQYDGVKAAAFQADLSTKILLHRNRPEHPPRSEIWFKVS